MSTPVRCDNCRHVWPSFGIMIVNSQASLKGNKEGPCPKCGGMGSVQDGEYSYSSDSSAKLIRGPASSFAAFKELYGALTAPDVSRADLEAIEVLARSAKMGNLPPEDVAAAVAAIDPKIAATITSDTAAWAGLVIAILALLFAVWTWQDDKISDANQAERDERAIAILKSIQESLVRQGAVAAPIPKEPTAPTSQRHQRRLVARKAEKAARKRARAKTRYPASGQ